ncbi:MAG: hypothetical protein NTW86_21190 [Candidatus Sumerlaeota bacterium]|nr:hypothetical protein [Candidatus Sumerlaeota bacterium]
MKKDLMEAAVRLAEHSAEGEPNMKEILLFPSENEIRLVEVDELAMPNGGRAIPFHFGADVEGRIPYRSAIALILPEEKAKIALPEGWGTWEDAVRIWPREAA